MSFKVYDPIAELIATQFPTSNPDLQIINNDVLVVSPHKITLPMGPQNAGDVTNKAYVDQAVMSAAVPVASSTTVGTIQMAGDLEGSSGTNPIIAANKITLNKLQKIGPKMVIGNPNSDWNNTQEIELDSSFRIVDNRLNAGIVPISSTDPNKSNTVIPAPQQNGLFYLDSSGRVWVWAEHYYKCITPSRYISKWMGVGDFQELTVGQSVMWDSGRPSIETVSTQGLEVEWISSTNFTLSSLYLIPIVVKVTICIPLLGQPDQMAKFVLYSVSSAQQPRTGIVLTTDSSRSSAPIVSEYITVNWFEPKSYSVQLKEVNSDSGTTVTICSDKWLANPFLDCWITIEEVG
ncbi:hypothetical protein MIV008L [Invertebrate iridescent virus 3]|uniref:Uncharacterized protein 008L n=1 Tax=Invertebrate iridescent virus 3 TaxID=345201 RepID=008L_IIV3|nr:hypothetical protein MIV008L [Invertebrate iridescent virus 3]Q197F2.1 RecName: Full=Uncharacterized protein 008L [Invertebrate iridescent virus 3]ABF82038.1 hypothetical protein MIV008L [Invertebrate iridescent virus 3]